MKEKTRILIVDDDVMTCKSLSLIFKKKGYETESATTGKEALEITKNNSFNIALLDLKLPDMDGIELISPIKERWPEVKVIVLTMYGSYRADALASGADAFLVKGCPAEELLEAILGH